MGFIDDEGGPIDLLVNKWKVALPLHAEYGTEPNVFYVPPILPPTFDENGELSDDSRVPLEYMEYLFGDGVQAALDTIQSEMDKKKEGKESELMDLLIAKEWKSLFNIPDVRTF